jgi:hypothetical protein
MVIVVDHGVREAACLGDHRDRPVPQSVELSKSTRLEARRYDEHVESSLHEVWEAFVMSDKRLHNPRRNPPSVRVSHAK